ncbi:enoyl-CoA hydratase-related protein [Actinomadura geliboluensis]
MNAADKIEGTAVNELVHLTVHNSIATITLDSPSNRNALSRQLVGELGAHLHTAMNDPEVRAIVLTATGTVFCAGGDLKERGIATADDQDAPSFADILHTIMTGATPVVLKLNGPARAGGLGLIAAADIAIAPSEATFAFSEVRIGVAPAIIAVPCTRKMTARSIARYFLTGATFDAAAAKEAGLVTIVSDDVEASCAEVLTALRLAAPGALRAAKALITQARDQELGAALTAMEAESARLFSSDEAKEGMAAFLEKRAPSWTAPA